MPGGVQCVCVCVCVCVCLPGGVCPRECLPEGVFVRGVSARAVYTSPAVKEYESNILP